MQVFLQILAFSSANWWVWQKESALYIVRIKILEDPLLGVAKSIYYVDITNEVG